jgi:hypothetical protein
MDPNVYSDGQKKNHLIGTLSSSKDLHTAIEKHIDLHISDILNSPHFSSEHIDTIINKGGSNLLLDLLSDDYSHHINSKHIFNILRDEKRGRFVAEASIQHPSFGDEHMNLLMNHQNHLMRKMGINSDFFKEKYLNKGLIDPEPSNRLAAANSPYVNKSHIPIILNDKDYYVALSGLSHPEFRLEHLPLALYHPIPHLRVKAMDHYLFQANKHKYKDYLQDMSNHRSSIVSQKAEEILKDINN